MVKEEFAMPASADNLVKKKSDNQPDNKDRTLFCINIEAKCSEDILYELFLQAGPIEKIIRKEDKNGNLICLITYKHAVSCDYAIKIFNGISLFGMPMKVQLSQQPGAAGGTERRRQSINNYQNIGRDRDQSYQRDQGYQRDQSYHRDQRESRRSQVSYEHMTQTDSPASNGNLNSLMGQQFAEFGTAQSFANPYSDLINRNISTNFNFEGNNNNNGHQSRRNHNNNGGGNYNRGNSRGYSNDNRGGGNGPDMWRNQSNNGRHGKNGSYDNTNQSRDNNNRKRDSKDRSRSPHEQRRQQHQQRNNNRY